MSEENNEQKHVHEGAHRPVKRKKKKKPTQQVKINVLGCLVVLILLVVIAVGGFFAYNHIFNSVIDKEYKEALLIGMGLPKGDVKKLESIMGEKELELLVNKYNEFPQAYRIDDKERGDLAVFGQGLHRANLHAHTTVSDGQMSVEEFLSQAANYADKVKQKYPKEKYPYVIALTDHNRIEQNKIALKTIYNNPEKYKNLKLVLGLEIWAYIDGGEISAQKSRNAIHLLAWAINPFDRAFTTLRYEEYPIAEAFSFIRNQRYGFIGIAHPVREVFVWHSFAEGKDIYNWISDMFDLYVSKNNGKMMFAEAYYQRYRFDADPKWLAAVIKECDKRGIKKTGSLDTHTPKIYQY